MHIRWVKTWIDSMAALTEQFRDKDGKVDFAALGREEYEFRRALVTGDYSRSERARSVALEAEETFAARSAAGMKANAVRWHGNAAGPMPGDKQVVIDFASEESLDVDDACECWFVTTSERNGKTADGQNIIDWKHYVKKWCKTRSKRRAQ